MPTFWESLKCKTASPSFWATFGEIGLLFVFTLDRTEGKHVENYLEQRNGPKSNFKTNENFQPTFSANRFSLLDYIHRLSSPLWAPSFLSICKIVDKKFSFLGTKKREARRSGSILASYPAAPGSYPLSSPFRNIPSLTNKMYFILKNYPRRRFRCFLSTLGVDFWLLLFFFSRSFSEKKFVRIEVFYFDLSFLNPSFETSDLMDCKAKRLRLLLFLQ